MIGAEFAKNAHRYERDIEDVPAFRRYLKRNGLRDLAEWETRNRSASRSADLDAESLTLRARYVALKAKR